MVKAGYKLSVQSIFPSTSCRIAGMDIELKKLEPEPWSRTTSLTAFLYCFCMAGSPEWSNSLEWNCSLTPNDFQCPGSAWLQSASVME